MNIPLALAVVEVRFPESAPLTDDQVANLKKSLNGRFPIYKHEIRNGFTSTVNYELGTVANSPIVEVLHHFLARSLQTGATLTSKSLVVETTDYKSWLELKKMFVETLGAVNDIVHLDGYQRVGCRYIDEFRLEGADDWASIISPGLVAPSWNAGPQSTKLEAQMFQAIYSTDTVGITSTLRFGQMSGPPVIGSSDYLVRTNLPGESTFFLLDTDCAWQLPQGLPVPPVSIQEISQLSEQLHDLISSAFLMVTTSKFQTSIEAASMK